MPTGKILDAAPRLGADTDRAVLDLLPDEFLDIGQVGVGFEVTPVSLVCSAESSVCPIFGRVVTTSFHGDCSVLLTEQRSAFENTQGIQQFGSVKFKRS